MKLLQSFLVVACLAGASYAGSSSNCEPFESHFIAIIKDITYALQLRHEFTVDYLQYLGPFAIGALTRDNGIQYDLYSSLIFNLTASISQTLTPEQIRDAVEGTIPVPHPLDCIWLELKEILDLITKNANEDISAPSQPSKPSPDSPCSVIKAWFVEISVAVEIMIVRRIEYIRAELNALSCNKDLLTDYAAKRESTERQSIALFWAETLSIEISVVAQFLSGTLAPSDIPDILQCVGREVLSLTFKYESMSREAVIDILNPCAT